MWAYVTAVWDCRYFWLSLVKMDLQARYRRSVLGIGWSLLQPVATMLVLCAVFHKIFHVEVRDYVPFLMAGLTWWAYIVGTTLGGCQCFVTAESYIRQHSVPMAVYALRTALGAMVHLLIALAVVFILSWYFKGWVNPLALLSLPVGLVLLFVFGWSVAVLAGSVNVIFRDIQHIAEIGFQILFYLTPIIYPPQMLSDTRVAWLVRYNPLVPFLKLIREPLEGQMPSARVFAAAAGVTMVVTAVAVALLGRVQRRVI
ncbi:MAG TPA: ABC transporter permease, partial [Gemmataceae bacterium]|nr:ABC transporter permease [Gemmataceae bacterium]